MEIILDKIKKSTEYVIKKAKYVSICYDKIDKLAEEIDISKMGFWLQSNPFNILNLGYKEIINFLLVYHTIGDYCFWGNPKWEIETPTGKLDGSYAIMYLLIKRYQETSDFNISFDEFKEFLKGNGLIPLLEDRYNNLIKMNQFLKSQNASFYDLIKDKTKDTELFQYIIENLSYFEDTSPYKNEIIYFYKRAQLLTSDILHIRKILENIEVDYSNLKGCADYKIPQVMRCLGLIEFSSELAFKVDNLTQLEKDSEEEIEIRAATIKVIDELTQKLENKVTRMDINDYIWLLGQNKERIDKPYHRVLTNKY